MTTDSPWLESSSRPDGRHFLVVGDTMFVEPEPFKARAGGRSILVVPMDEHAPRPTLVIEADVVDFEVDPGAPTLIVDSEPRP